MVVVVEHDQRPGALHEVSAHRRREGPVADPLVGLGCPVDATHDDVPARHQARRFDRLDGAGGHQVARGPQHRRLREHLQDAGGQLSRLVPVPVAEAHRVHGDVLPRVHRAVEADHPGVGRPVVVAGQPPEMDRPVGGGAGPLGRHVEQMVGEEMAGLLVVGLELAQPVGERLSRPAHRRGVVGHDAFVDEHHLDPGAGGPRQQIDRHAVGVA